MNKFIETLENSPNVIELCLTTLGFALVFSFGYIVVTTASDTDNKRHELRKICLTKHVPADCNQLFNNN